MKKKLLLGMAGLILAVLAASYVKTSRPGEAFDQPVNGLSGVSIEAVGGTAAKMSVTIRMINDTETLYTYGTYYDLQQLVGGTWRSMSYIVNNVAFTAQELFLEPGASVEQELDWGHSHGFMSSGTYRIVKEFYKGGENQKSYWLAAEFTIQ